MRTGVVVPFDDELEQMRRALELGLRDYVEKNGFSEVVLGVSGGIDSALVAALAAEALGPERVHYVSMPSRFSSDATRAGRARDSRSRSARPSSSCRSSRPSTRSRLHSRTSSPAVSRTRPRRTCRRAFAECS